MNTSAKALTALACTLLLCGSIIKSADLISRSIRESEEISLDSRICSDMRNAMPQRELAYLFSNGLGYEIWEVGGQRYKIPASSNYYSVEENLIELKKTLEGNNPNQQSIESRFVSKEPGEKNNTLLQIEELYGRSFESCLKR